MSTSAVSEQRGRPARALVSAPAGNSLKVAPKVDDNPTDRTASSEAEQLRARIAEAAYLRAEQRHFEPGHDVEDWLAAECDLKQS